MSDLHHVLPDTFPESQVAHLLPSLNRHHVTVSDILTIDAADLAIRAKVPIAELRELRHAIGAVLRADLNVNNASEPRAPEVADGLSDSLPARLGRTVSTLDDCLDAELGGGIPSGYLTEITGESGTGKTQILLTLLLSAQLPHPHGLSRSALYISTEAPLATARLGQILAEHPRINKLAPASKPSLSRILCMQTPDVESQDHVLRYQLPIAIQRHDVGLVVLDSVAANFRAELEKRPDRTTAQLVHLGALLRSLARVHGVVIVVANQVSDRISSATCSRSYSRDADASRAPAPVSTPSRIGTSRPMLSTHTLTLDYQQRWFTGWGDVPLPCPHHLNDMNLKSPALGLTWTNQIAARIALLKQPVHYPSNSQVSVPGTENENRVDTGRAPANNGWRRWMKLVFAVWGAPSMTTKGIEFVIRARGVAACGDGTDVLPVALLGNKSDIAA